LDGASRNEEEIIEDRMAHLDVFNIFLIPAQVTITSAKPFDDVLCRQATRNKRISKGFS